MHWCFHSFILSFVRTFIHLYVHSLANVYSSYVITTSHIPSILEELVNASKQWAVSAHNKPVHCEGGSVSRRRAGSEQQVFIVTQKRTCGVESNGRKVYSFSPPLLDGR